jgi:uncharacterized protein YndB with AHSA1/START domain
VATTEKLINAPPEDVFEILADPDSHDQWVAAPGQVKVTDVDPGRRIVMEVSTPPLAVVRVEIELIPQGDGTCVRMLEHPTGGLLKPMNNRLFELIAHVRNTRGLDRLADLVEA